MSVCCSGGCGLNASQQRQRQTLKRVFAINAVMFLVIFSAALYGGSAALLSDSFDNLGDAFTYALSLFVLGSSLLVKARVALVKGLLILAGALIVSAQIIARLFEPSLPLFEVMGIFSLLGLVANGICLALLWQHRDEDINMSSVWECSRNDIASNLSVFVAAFAIWLTDSGWPDIVVATALVVLLTRSALRVIGQARSQIHSSVALP